MSYNLLIVWGTVPRSLNVVILHTQNTLKCAILEEKFQNCVPTPVGMGTTPPHTQLPRGLRATRRSPPLPEILDLPLLPVRTQVCGLRIRMLLLGLHLQHIPEVIRSSFCCLS